MHKKIFYDLAKFQRKHLSKETIYFIKSIESGLFTGIRNNKGEIREDVNKSNLAKNMKRYSEISKEIEDINYLFCKQNNLIVGHDIQIYRGINCSPTRYNDIVPTSWSFNKEIAINFSYDKGSVLIQDIQLTLPIIVNITEGDLNEFEIILPPTNYRLLKIYDGKHIFKDDNEEYKFNQFIVKKV